MDKELRKIVGAISQKVANTSTGHCRECGISWDFVEGKHISLSEKKGFFIVCEACWENLNIVELLKHCETLHNEWEFFGGPNGDPTLNEMFKAAIEEYVKGMDDQGKKLDDLLKEHKL